ncbi:hypothetical protein PRIPAC_73050, partial [Pristionchus pacificus]|uniref:Uncharacterized protein n=1 Tax=Pristionchus pacificus TaxID=54126 RepID=A0A2A6C0Z0_PRIPA
MRIPFQARFFQLTTTTLSLSISRVASRQSAPPFDNFNHVHPMFILKAEFRIVRSITQAGTLYYFLYECSTKSEEWPAHEHKTIREWVARIVENEGTAAFDDVAKAFTKKLSKNGTSPIAPIIHSI